MRAFILAGGFATRLWPLTEKRAKPLLPLAGVEKCEKVGKDMASLQNTLLCEGMNAIAEASPRKVEKWKSAKSKQGRGFPTTHTAWRKKQDMPMRQDCTEAKSRKTEI